MLVIKKKGMIKGGKVDISYESATELFHVVGSADIGIGPFTKKYEIKESKKIPKSYMEPSYWTKGKKEKFDDINVEVVEHNGKTALVKFWDDHGDSGKVIVDLTLKHIDIITLFAEGNYMNYRVEIEAERI